MAYQLYLDGVLFPVTPSKIQLTIKGQNKTLNLINDGEVNVLKTEGLKEISFDVLLPNVRYPFALYKDGYKNASYYMEKLQSLMDLKRPFQYILVRWFPDRKNIGATNITCALESFSVVEEASEGFDALVNIKLKAYRPYGTKVAAISNGYTSFKSKRETANAPKAGTTYTVQPGDCLWKIARMYYGDGAEYKKIYDANKDKISNPNLIYPGQTLIIP